MLKQLPKFLLFSLVSLYGCSSTRAIDQDKASSTKNIDNVVQTASIEVSTSQKKEKYTGIVGKVDAIAEQITVRIDNKDDGSNGSGVIVARQGNTYYVLTAKHVVCSSSSKPECGDYTGIHEIVTHDGAVHQLDNSRIEANQSWLDIAIVSFESSNDYQIATIGKYQPKSDWIFTSGFPSKSERKNSSRIIMGGKLFSDELEEFITVDNLSLAQNKAKGHNGMLYTNISYRGMSGGAILDTEGKLIGINTGAEQKLYDEGDNPSYELYNLGFSLGESVTDLLGYISQNKIELKSDWLNISTNVVTELQPEQIISVRNQLLKAKAPKDNSDISAWMDYGNQLWRYGRYIEARAAFEQILEINPQFHQAYYALSLVYVYQEDFEKALVALTKATKINSNRYYYWRWLGYTYRFLSQFDEARIAYEQAIKINPNDFVLFVEYGIVLSNAEHHEAAIDAYNKVIQLNSNHIWVYENIGIVYFNYKKYEKAIDNYNQAISINPQYARAYFNRGVAYFYLGEYEKAITDYDRAVSINPQSDRNYVNRGLAYAELEKYEKAFTDYDRAISINPNLAEAYNNRGALFEELKQYEKAIRDIAKAISINPRNASAHNNLGVIHEELGQYEKAITDYNQAISINSNFADAYYNRGIVYERLGQYEKAITDYDQAISINPRSSSIYNNRGLTYAKLKQYDQAIKDLNQAISINPQYAEAYINRGLTFTNLEKYKEAIRDLNQAISINPQYVEAYVNRGLVYTYLEQYEEAIADYNHALLINPQLALVYNNRGVAYLNLKSYYLAKKDAQKAGEIYSAQNNSQGYQGTLELLRLIEEAEKQS